MRSAGRLQGNERYRAYGDLDVELARDAVPSAPINFLNEATLVSNASAASCFDRARPDRRLPDSFGSYGAALRPRRSPR